MRQQVLCQANFVRNLCGRCMLSHLQWVQGSGRYARAHQLSCLFLERTWSRYGPTGFVETEESPLTWRGSYRCVLPVHRSSIGIVSNSVNSKIMFSWFVRKESFDDEKTFARVMRACEVRRQPRQLWVFAGYMIFEITRHDGSGSFFGSVSTLTTSPSQLPPTNTKSTPSSP